MFLTRVAQSRSIPRNVATILALFMILSTAGCGISSKPRRHWYEFWRTKPVSQTTGDILYPEDDVLPPVPDPLDPNGTGGARDLDYDNELPPPPTEIDPSTMVENDPIREPASPSSELKTVFFAFDSFELDGGAVEALNNNAKWLRDNPNFDVQIEGHADERGTLEYNLNLGDQRAKAVKAYLVSRGISAERLHTISYGEERPLNPSSSESAYSENRRAQFLVY